jgi:hypothetical protein
VVNSWIRISETVNKYGTYVVLSGYQNGGFNFGKILYIVREEERNPKLVIKHYERIGSTSKRTAT